MAGEVDFWFDFASTYSYLSAMRIEVEAARRDVTVRWRPFLLGPIFAAQGWGDSPFNLYPVKGRYMWRDLERRSERFGIVFRGPDPDGPRFPQASLLAARAALVALEAGQGPAFCRAVFASEYAEGRDIADPALIAQIGGALGLHDILTDAISPANKGRLRDNVEQAIAHGVFGAPGFITKGELFWGDDRLEDALDWASV
ncbi:MAG TPA: 2-hydroxychromene-2-carboxylate isomerase [Sphingobium sp.]|uniref:2-hydroxychromene-2-carboxylate isomerase n=1 Tax=Sphingobium sp. TaxID=1912891 RepID=UPI002ED24DFD